MSRDIALMVLTGVCLLAIAASVTFWFVAVWEAVRAALVRNAYPISIGVAALGLALFLTGCEAPTKWCSGSATGGNYTALVTMPCDVEGKRQYLNPETGAWEYLDEPVATDND